MLLGNLAVRDGRGYYLCVLVVSLRYKRYKIPAVILCHVCLTVRQLVYFRGSDNQ